MDDRLRAVEVEFGKVDQRLATLERLHFTWRMLAVGGLVIAALRFVLRAGAAASVPRRTVEQRLDRQQLGAVLGAHGRSGSFRSHTWDTPA